MKWDENRYNGIAKLYGVKGIERISRSHVIIVGIGGVGSWVAEALARSGVGKITLIDLDDICVSNTNRQLHALRSNIGLLKVEVVEQRLKDINPAIIVEPITDFLTEDNLKNHLTLTADYVVDCIDNAKIKAAMIAFCKRNKLSIITSGAAGGQIDPTKILVRDLNKTSNDPLIAKVRYRLRKFYNFSRKPNRHYSVPCVFSLEQLRYPTVEGSICNSKNNIQTTVGLDCSGGLGATMTVTTSFAMIIAAKVLEKISKNNNLI